MNSADRKKLREFVEDITYAMLTTREANGTLHSRPMHTEKMERGDKLLFITQADTPKARELKRHPQVSLTYVKGDADACVAIAGRARIRRDLAKLKELWKPFYKAWFPKGLEDPQLAILEVRIGRAEYWKTPASVITRALGTMKALATGKPVGQTIGDHKQVRGN
jgi:general stress protein 26